MALAELRTCLPVAEAAAAASGPWRGRLNHYAFVAKTESAADIAEDVWDFCLVGIGGRAAT
jgi:hypothetical protein